MMVISDLDYLEATHATAAHAVQGGAVVFANAGAFAFGDLAFVFTLTSANALSLRSYSPPVKK